MKEDIKYPICPINLHWEGEEGKIDQDKCDFDTNTRMCSEACVRREQGGITMEYFLLSTYVWTARSQRLEKRKLVKAETLADAENKLKTHLEEEYPNCKMMNICNETIS